MHPAYDGPIGRLRSLALPAPFFIRQVALTLPSLVVAVSIICLALFLALLIDPVFLLLFHSTLLWTR